MVTIGLAMALTVMATPQAASPVCPRDAAPVPAALSAWTSPVGAAVAGEGPGDVPEIASVGSWDVTLHRGAGVRFAAAPGRAQRADRHAGMVRLTIARAGRYQAALGGRGWVDLVRDGTTVASVGHGHGPACSGIVKIVVFALEPGQYLLQVADNPEAEVRVMAAPTS